MGTEALGGGTVTEADQVVTPEADQDIQADEKVIKVAGFTVNKTIAIFVLLLAACFPSFYCALL